MRFKVLEHIQYVPVVSEPTVTLLFFPPESRTRSGIYLLRPNGEGGNIVELLQAVDVERRTAKAWFLSESARAKLVRGLLDDPGSMIRKLVDSGEARWSSLPAEELVRSVMMDPNLQTRKKGGE